MKLLSRVVMGLLVVASPRTANGQAPATPASRSIHDPLERMPPDLEVRFALSALPPHLRDQATVYVLDPSSGYLIERRGSNGMSCLVERTEWARVDFRNDIYLALCYDAEGAANLFMANCQIRERSLGFRDFARIVPCAI